MTNEDIAAISSWLAEAGLGGALEVESLQGFSERAVTAGVPLARVVCFIDTLHPIHEGRAVRWAKGDVASQLIEYGRTGDGEANERWRMSPHFQMLSTGQTSLRRRLSEDAESEFPILAEMRAAGLTDYFTAIKRFEAQSVIGEMDCFYAAFSTDHPEGFEDAHLVALERLTPILGLAIKAASLARIAETLAETYLGRDAGRKVLRGRIARGVADRIEAALWFSDLRNYTRISEASPPEEIIPLLNDYAEAIISAIQAEGGDVLKLIGDGVLAIFPSAERASACAAALRAAEQAMAAVEQVSARRLSEGAAATQMYLGLHFGEAFYGNIGSHDRLDFTVVGPAVNEVSRIAAMCRSVDQRLLMSSAFAQTISGAERRLAAVGRFALRGVAGSQLLYTLDTLD
jgi:adenylate cyclase